MVSRSRFNWITNFRAAGGFELRKICCYLNDEGAFKYLISTITNTFFNNQSEKLSNLEKLNYVKEFNKEKLNQH